MPRRPVSRLIDVAPVLIVDADGIVIPMTHDVSGSLRLGSLHDEGLAALAAEWLDAGAGDELAMACEQAWVDLTSTSPPLAVYWYDEVAARTWAGVPLRRTLELVPALR